MKNFMLSFILSFVLVFCLVGFCLADCNECDEWQNMNGNISDLSGILNQTGPVDNSTWPGGSNWSGATGDWTDATTLEKITEWLTSQVDFETEKSDMTDWLTNNTGDFSSLALYSSALSSGVSAGGGSGTVTVALPNASFDLSFVGCEETLDACGTLLVAFAGLLGLLVFLF